MDCNSPDLNESIHEKNDSINDDYEDTAEIDIETEEEKSEDLVIAEKSEDLVNSNSQDLNKSIHEKNDSINDDYEDTVETDIETEEEKSEDLVIAEKSEDLVIAEEHYEKDYLEFIEKLFPKKRQDWNLQDTDLISLTESYSRLTWLGIILTCILALITIGQIIHVSLILLSEESPIIVQPRLPMDKFIRKFPLPHLITVSENGEVYDFSLFENISPSRGFLFKLPKAEHYHVFSDPKGVLYFVDSELKRDVVQYHQNISKQGHQVIPTSGLDVQSPKLYFQSLLINGFFWLFHCSEMHFPSIYQPAVGTST